MLTSECSAIEKYCILGWFHLFLSLFKSEYNILSLFVCGRLKAIDCSSASNMQINSMKVLSVVSCFIPNPWGAYVQVGRVLVPLERQREIGRSVNQFIISSYLFSFSYYHMVLFLKKFGINVC